MTDEEFAAACEKLAELADAIESGTPEQIYAHSEDGWWDAYATLGRVYNAWLMGDESDPLAGAAS